MFRRASWLLLLAALGCCIGAVTARVGTHARATHGATGDDLGNDTQQKLPPNVKVGRGVTFIPPGAARPRQGKPGCELMFHSPKKQRGETTVISGWGGIPVHFTLTHRGKSAAAVRYQVAVQAMKQSRNDHSIAAEKLMAPYELANGESKTDEFVTFLPVAPGYYSVAVEVRSLYPVVDGATQERRRDYATVWRGGNMHVKVAPDDLLDE